MTALVTMGNWSSMNATTCRLTALNRSSAAQRLDSSLVCQRRSRGRTVTIRSSSCSAVLYAIGWTQGRRRARGPFEHTVLVRPTAFHPASGTSAGERIEFQALYRLLVY